MRRIMIRKLFIISALIAICSPAFADQLAKIESETARELLLFYDWEELLVEAPTRRPTSLKDVAENVSIITAEEIVQMNAHSVNEILQTVTGVQIAFFGGHFGGAGGLGIHASEYEHVLLLLDGVRLNDVDAGWPETSGIPVQIIDRIEIVKGPASSAWGSALGGVVNIITKQPGSTQRPTGTVYGSYGEGSSQDYRADAAGRLGKFSYYLHGGYMNSDGLVDDKYFKNKSFYGKFNSELTRDISLTFTAGYWFPDYKIFDLPEFDLNYLSNIENFLVTGKLGAKLSQDLKLDINLSSYSQKWQNSIETLTTGDLVNLNTWDNVLFSGNANLTWTKNRHIMLFGIEINRGENDRTWLYTSAPPINWGTETRKDWSVYFNDTIKWEKLTITPGVRYDYLSIVDASSYDLISPSLGTTYKVTDHTLLRATAARGFIRPGIGLTVGDGVGYPGDPELKPEDLWSLQGGIESTHFDNTHLKADVFYHHQDDTWYWNDADVYVNGGVSERAGFELNGTVRPFVHFTAGLGFTYIWLEHYMVESDSTYGLNLKMNYSSERAGSLTLFGRYYWWSEEEAGSSGSYDDMIWDLHYNKDIYTHKDSGTIMNFFVSGRNLFNGEHYTFDLVANPERWFEAGLRFNF